MRAHVVIPALDEEAAIGRVLADLPRDRVGRIIVVDNGCTDRTAAVALAHGATVVREPRRGYGAACLRGIRAAGPCDVLVFLDADYSDHPDELPRLLAPLRQGGADLVIGSRMRAPASRRALLPQARFGNRLAAVLLNALFGGRTSDLGPFRAIRRDALLRLEMDDHGFGWTVQMQARALARGLRVVEVPVSYRPRIGRSKISGTVAGSVRAGTRILLTIARERIKAGRRDGVAPPLLS